MPSIAVTEFTTAISAATSKGVLTVTSNAGLMPGALAWVYKTDDSARARVKILSVSSTTGVVVRRFANDDENSAPSYGRSDMSAFNAGSKITMEAQSAPVDPAFAKHAVP